jgi:tRNA pseudouridine55 synthase
MTGVLPVDKPAGPTSHDVVAAARRALGTRRVGHTGTLDPFATGLLLLCIGPATRLAEYLTGLDKRYEATALLGIATDTLDRTGQVVKETEAWRELQPDAIRRAFVEQVGQRRQTPPAFSAKKIGGTRAYELARAGIEVQPDPVQVEIQSIQVAAIDGPEVRFQLHCSSGTYVRAVARDAGTALGVGAHLTELRRTTIGRFRVGDALAMADLESPSRVEAALVSPLAALAHLPQRTLDPDQARRVRHGQAIPAGDTAKGLVALAEQQRLVAVAESDGESIRPRKVFA